jgi:DNA-binding NarL/FixJ family response regulator
VKESINVLVVDDHAVVRAGLVSIISSDPSIKVVGEAEDGIEAVEKAVSLCPDVVMMDVNMPRANGLEALVAMKEKLPDIKVLIITVSDNEEDLFSAIRYGAQGYILKNSSIDQLLEAVKKTAAGEAMLSPNLATRLISEFRKKQNEEDILSEREREVLALVGEGKTNSEIAAALYIGETTVRTHLQRLLYKLHLKNRAEAIAYANRHNVRINTTR